MGIEIEKKYLVKELPKDLEKYRCRVIEQAYLCREPVMRIRRSDDEYYFTYKGKGLEERIEYNLPMNEESYMHMLKKADGIVIAKKRYEIPLEGGLLAELDVFETPQGLVMAEVEFENPEQAKAFEPPEWFGREVTFDRKYHNVNMAYG